MKLDEIKGRWSKATPGPWESWEVETFESVPHGQWYEWRIVPEGKYKRDDHIAIVYERMTKELDENGRRIFLTDQDRANADAIGHAPSDIAALLTEIERLEGELKRAQYILEP